MKTLAGRTACAGLVTGKPCIVTTAMDLNKVRDGDILVAAQTDISYIGALCRAAGIVTESGGRFSHAAIWARENGKPALVGVAGARGSLENVATVTLDATAGQVRWED